MGLALVAAQKQYPLILVIPDKMSQEKVNHLKALGAEVVMTRSDVGRGHPAYYQDLAEAIARRTPRSFYVNQFNNPANPLAHETTTAPEIWRQCDARLDAVVCGVGSGGTITGLSRFFARMAPHVEMVLADPVGSVLADYVRTGKVGEAGSWLVEGIGEDFIPGDRRSVARAAKRFRFPTPRAFALPANCCDAKGCWSARRRARWSPPPWPIAGSRPKPKRVVTFACDSGNKYLSKMYNDFWMADQGLATAAAPTAICAT